MQRSANHRATDLDLACLVSDKANDRRAPGDNLLLDAITVDENPMGHVLGYDLQINALASLHSEPGRNEGELLNIHRDVDAFLFPISPPYGSRRKKVGGQRKDGNKGPARHCEFYPSGGKH